MAITKSGLYVGTWLDIHDATQYTFDFLTNTIKGALVSDTYAPDFTAAGHTNYANLTNILEDNPNWPTGGVTLGTKAVSGTAVAESLVWDAADISQASTTISNAMALVLYVDDGGSDRLICLIDFVTAVTTSNGTLDITFTAPGSGGIFNFDLA